MKKLTRLLALVLAAVMLLSCGAFAAEGDEEESKELWMQWINPEDLGANDDPHYQVMDLVPYDVFNIALYTCDNRGEKLTPAPADKLEASDGLVLYPMCPDKRGMEHFVAGYVTEWNKEYTISYKGYSLTIESRLPDIGLYSGPEATTENYMKGGMNFNYSPVTKNPSAYVIVNATDETRGRHVTKLALSKEENSSENFTMEKVSDNVYKLTVKGDINQPYMPAVIDVTWQDAKFLGGRTYTEQWWTDASERTVLLVGDEPAVTDFEAERPLYDDVKDDYANEITIKAGETKEFYISGANFNYETGRWEMVSPHIMLLNDISSDNLKITPDKSEDAHQSKGSMTCSVPGTYTVNAVFGDIVVDAIYHKNGNQYNRDELREWQDENYSRCGLDEDYNLVIIQDFETGETLTFEEAFPGEKVIFHVNDIYWIPFTVTVEAAELPFTDLNPDAWYIPAISFVNSKGYMNGYGDGSFKPDGEITSAEFVQLLYNKEDKPAPAEGTSFAGVTDDQWFAPAIYWAAGKGIITDTGETAIKPDDKLTRQQMALILYNYLEKPAGTADLTVFSDADQLSAWAKPAMEWAVSAKVFKGNADGTLNPAGNTTRAQVAQLLLNYFG